VVILKELETSVDHDFLTASLDRSRSIDFSSDAAKYIILQLRVEEQALINLAALMLGCVAVAWRRAAEALILLRSLDYELMACHLVD